MSEVSHGGVVASIGVRVSETTVVKSENQVRVKRGGNYDGVGWPLSVRVSER